MLCKKIEVIAPAFGCHVALTGGCLYKDGDRKDIDILFYKIRQVENIDIDGLFSALDSILKIEKLSGFGWCYKLKHNDISIDAFFPENEGGDYTKKNGDIKW